MNSICWRLALVSTLWTALSVNAAEPLEVTHIRLQVTALTEVKDLTCRFYAKTARTKRVNNVEPVEIPDQEDIKEALAELSKSSIHARSEGIPIKLKTNNKPFKIGIWGDSHLAAGFFSEELLRAMGLDSTRPSFIPASLGRAGVRLPLRRSCLSPHWRYEPAYSSLGGASRPGPGLINLVSAESGAEIAFDARTSDGSRVVENVHLLFERTASPLSVAISVDDGAEKIVSLEGPPGPASLDLIGDAPMSTVKIRLLAGQFRFHGFELVPTNKPLLQLDVYGIPGATAAAWKQSDLAYLSSWFTENPYDVVILQYGTNEGNVRPFDPENYKKMLTTSVANLRSVWPAAACVLIGPGDRGILVQRSSKANRTPNPRVSIKLAKGQKLVDTEVKSGGLRQSKNLDVLKYSRIHAEITQIQEDVSREFGCVFWSAYESMGGAGSAYIWARNMPQLMANDLTHFTVKGYQRLAQDFSSAMSWSNSRVGKKD